MFAITNSVICLFYTFQLQIPSTDRRIINIVFCQTLVFTVEAMIRDYVFTRCSDSKQACTININ